MIRGESGRCQETRFHSSSHAEQQENCPDSHTLLHLIVLVFMRSFSGHVQLRRQFKARVSRANLGFITSGAEIHYVPYTVFIHSILCFEKVEIKQISQHYSFFPSSSFQKRSSSDQRCALGPGSCWMQQNRTGSQVARYESQRTKKDDVH